jgi:hypothetical protein
MNRIEPTAGRWLGEGVIAFWPSLLVAGALGEAPVVSVLVAAKATGAPASAAAIKVAESIVLLSMANSVDLARAVR